MRKLFIFPLLFSFASGFAVAGEESQFFRDPIPRNKHLRQKLLYGEKPETLEAIDPKQVKEQPKEAVSIQAAVLKGVSIKGSSVKQSKFDFIFKPYIGKKIDDKEATEILNKLKGHYKECGFLLPRVEFDGMHYGTMHFKVTEGKIRDVELLVDKNYEDEVVKNKLVDAYIKRILESNPAKTKEVQRNLLLINKIPGYKAEYELRPITSGATEGNEMADLVLEIVKKRGDLDIDITDHGSERLGRYQFSAYSHIHNPTKSNDNLLLGVGTSNRPARMMVTTLGYLKRLNSYGTSASITGSYSYDNDFRAQKLSAKDDTSKTLRGQLSHYLVLDNTNSVRLDGGVDYRKVKEYTNTQLSTDYDYTMAFLGARVKHNDFLGGENWVHPFFYSSLNSSLTRISSAVTNFDKNFNYLTLDYYRDQALPRNFSLFTQVIWHHSNDDLPLEQQFFVGGNTIGRGYKSGLINSSRGINGDIELRYNHEVNNKNINNIQFFGFYDIAKFSKTSETTSKKTLSSAGAGFRIFMLNDFKGEFEVALPSTRHVTVGGITHKNSARYQFLVGKSFEW
ncbi:MAG: hypothetical protein K0T99_04770 [Alphaproteobacteria bacterium]|nr:hypothetical protein [Alphaproteobacteria bacterium]